MGDYLFQDWVILCLSASNIYLSNVKIIVLYSHLAHTDLVDSLGSTKTFQVT